MDLKARRELETEVEREVKNFHTWLEETKNLEPTTAQYHSASLKSLLLGLKLQMHLGLILGSAMFWIIGNFLVEIPSNSLGRANLKYSFRAYVQYERIFLNDII